MRFLLPLLCALMACSAHAANPDKLWEIVTQECLPNSISIEKNDPKPCVMVDRERGFAILKNISGIARYLLIPTKRLAGIESEDLLKEDAPNYWRYAWEQRDRVGQLLGRSLEPDQLGLQINSAATRSQLQLHIHINCMRQDMATILRKHRHDPLQKWMPLYVDKQRYSIMRLPADALEKLDPFKLAAGRSAYAASNMAAQSLLLTGARFDHGEEGFYLINTPINFDKKQRGSASIFMDNDCTMAK